MTAEALRCASGTTPCLPKARTRNSWRNGSQHTTRLTSWKGSSWFTVKNNTRRAVLIAHGTPLLAAGQAPPRAGTASRLVGIRDQSTGQPQHS
ncbi:hypothetical protein Anapl_01494 [Anas platyrhynchos]|uniref:Uncharacterized protein n=1 Tax=Anas platyrhynchos TaxID=8839 RepID=R0M6Q8_ANAPL|nr:hypothetical protein Anapl_01494 [Anas platyrhynchos]